MPSASRGQLRDLLRTAQGELDKVRRIAGARGDLVALERQVESLRREVKEREDNMDTEERLDLTRRAQVVALPIDRLAPMNLGMGPTAVPNARLETSPPVTQSGRTQDARVVSAAPHEAEHVKRLADAAQKIQWAERGAARAQTTRIHANAAPGTESQRDQWVAEYRAATLEEREIVSVSVDGFTYIFDSTHSNPAGSADNRVVGVYGTSGESHGPRDKSRMSGHPNPRHIDRGHFVNRASGGGYDINLFPQDSKLNQGQSEEGKVWREMEQYMTDNEGTEFFVRPTYDDLTDYPSRLEFGIRLTDGSWRIESFDNRPQ